MEEMRIKAGAEGRKIILNIAPEPSGPDTIYVDPRLIAANNDFGWLLLAAIAPEDSDHNVFLSPAGIAQVLQLTWNGAEGTTQQAMRAALHLGDLALPEVNQANSDLMALLHSADPDVVIRLANALYVRGREALKPEFTHNATSAYRAGIGSLDEGADPINTWVSRQTNGAIPFIVDEVEVRQSAAILLNAIYFKGNWQKPFPASSTRAQPFTQSDGTQSSCHMMRVSNMFAYYADAHLQMLSMPYGVGNVSMIVLLPAIDRPMSDFIAQLDSKQWKIWMSQLRESEGVVALPRFRVEYETELKDALTHLGMGLAFDALDADFSHMARKGLFLDKVKHRAFIDVNEEGTEAAAATAVMMSRGIKAVRPQFSMIVDRPFICAIVENSTHAVLFLGMINTPEK